MNGVGELVEKGINRWTTLVAGAAIVADRPGRNAGRQARTVQIVQQRVQLAHVALRRRRRVLIVAGHHLGVIGIRHLLARRKKSNEVKATKMAFY